MNLAVGILGLLLAVALLLVIALLRSHAEILRRLASIESSLESGPDAVSARPGDSPLLRQDVPPLAETAGAGGAAPDIGGQTLAGDGVKLSLGAGAPDTLLAFMGTGCLACVPLWEGLHDELVPTPPRARLVVVTKGPERERLARLLELAPAGLELVMSTRAWTDFGVPSMPHFVLVREGQIAGRGSATSWQQITTFLTDADDDDRLHRARMLDTDARAARAERALAQAGIGPDHPSLYPSQRAPAQHSGAADRITAAGLNGDSPPVQSHD
jgi:hypothetical protein